MRLWERALEEEVGKVGEDGEVGGGGAEVEVGKAVEDGEAEDEVEVGKAGVVGQDCRSLRDKLDSMASVMMGEYI